MSQLETNPLVNDTTLSRNPNQVVESLPTVQVHDFSNYNPLSRHVSSFNIPQTDWVSIAATEKYFDQLEWKVDSNPDLKIIEFSFDAVKKLIPVGLDINSYANLNSIVVSIKKTDNAFFQGAVIIAFDPAPFAGYYEEFFDTKLDLRHIWQFQKVLLSPKTSVDINLVIPINIPFEMFYLDSDFLTSYSFGRLRFYVMDTLATKGGFMSLKYAIQAQVMDLSTSGLKFDSS